MHYLGIDALGTDAEADDASGHSAEKPKPGEQPRRKRRFERSALAQHARNNPALHSQLQPLGDSGR
jgi:hypothetical protein